MHFEIEHSVVRVYGMVAAANSECGYISMKGSFSLPTTILVLVGALLGSLINGLATKIIRPSLS